MGLFNKKYQNNKAVTVLPTFVL